MSACADARSPSGQASTVSPWRLTPTRSCRPLTPQWRTSPTRSRLPSRFLLEAPDPAAAAELSPSSQLRSGRHRTLDLISTLYLILSVRLVSCHRNHRDRPEVRGFDVRSHLTRPSRS